MLYSGCVAVAAAIRENPEGGQKRHLEEYHRTRQTFGKVLYPHQRQNSAREIRVIDENGEQLGILPPFEALKLARERGLDLVEVSPNAVPPVCRIQDYGRYLYEKEKSERAARKKQKVIVVKEVKFSVTVDEHDYQTKKTRRCGSWLTATR